MTLEVILFYAFALLAIGSALLVVSLKNLARALFLFFIVLFAMAGLYLFALADFVAITQILIYVGGVLILMIFAFMLSNKELLADLQNTSKQFLSLPNWQAAVLAIGFLAAISYGIYEWQDFTPDWITTNLRNGQVIKPTDNTINEIGYKFITQYVLAFEIISIFLLMVLIGAAHISRREEQA
ncbi:NADH-quinone oxidoreductase subunit J family protein [Sphingobacterium hungaricum]